MRVMRESLLWVMIGRSEGGKMRESRRRFSPLPRRIPMLQWKARLTVLLATLSVIAVAAGGLVEPLHLGW
jgi:hypothetical protein